MKQDAKELEECSYTWENSETINEHIWNTKIYLQASFQWELHKYLIKQNKVEGKHNIF